MTEVFEDYRRALEGLRAGGRVEAVLRVFEKRLLEAVGYGVDLAAEARTGKPIEAGAFYRFQASQGLVPARDGDAEAVAGSSIMALAREELGQERVLEDARRVLKAALAQRLEGKELATRKVARAVASRGGSRT